MRLSEIKLSEKYFFKIVIFYHIETLQLHTYCQCWSCKKSRVLIIKTFLYTLFKVKIYAKIKHDAKRLTHWVSMNLFFNKMDNSSSKRLAETAYVRIINRNNNFLFFAYSKETKDVVSRTLRGMYFNMSFLWSESQHEIMWNQFIYIRT